MSKQPKFYGQGDPLMEATFASFVQWAWRDEKTREAFENETGMRIARSPIDAMIDEATGYQGEVMEAFARWVIVNVWGKAEDEGAE